MAEILTSAQMRHIEQAAIASGAVTGAELMRRAGAGVVAAVMEEWPELADDAQSAVVLCGPGNNGGDGFVVARLLRERGWAVCCILYGDPDRLPSDARDMYQLWSAKGAVRTVAHLQDIFVEADAVLRSGLLCNPTVPGLLAPDHRQSPGRMQKAQAQAQVQAPAPVQGKSLVIVDALFGIGLTRPLPAFERLTPLQWTVGLTELGIDPQWVAVDVPSGLCADSGRVLGDPAPDQRLPADLVVTFHAAKAGHYLADGPIACPRLRVVDIGLGWGAWTEASLRLVDGLGDFTLRRVAKQVGHKYGYGHVVILGGPPGHGGAARLAARSALRIGAGLVTLAVPPAALAENAARLDAVMLREMASASDLTAMLADSRYSTLCLGPGLGQGEGQAALVAAVLAARRPTVLDADALTHLSRDPELFAMLHQDCVLTPHTGEFARLFPDLAMALAAPSMAGPTFSKVDAVRAAAERAGCTVLLKGADTLIAGPDGAAALHSAARDRAAPWLATAGSGDVLAGLVAGLLWRLRHGPEQVPDSLGAAALAAYVHVEAARVFGPGLIAEDLPEVIPQVLRNHDVR